MSELRYLILEERRLTAGVPMVGHYSFRRADAGLVEHRHEGILEICYLVKGRQTYCVNGGDYQLRGNDLFVTQADEAHSTGGRPQEKGELYWLQVRMEKRRRLLLWPAAQAAPLRRELEKLPRHFPGDVELIEHFEAVFAAADAPGPLRRLALASAISVLLLAVVKIAGRNIAPPGQDRWTRVVQQMQRRLAEPPTIGQLAAEARLSLSWFKARFRREMGLGPAEFMVRARVEKAKELLGMKKSITDTAMALGFSSTQYFATVFKRYTGKTPKEWNQERAAGGG